MALIKRLSQLFKADFHAVLDQIEEPEQLLKQAIRDMEDELAAAGQRVILGAHEQEALSVRLSEQEDRLTEIDDQIDLCFESEKHDLAKNLIRKKLEAGRLMKHLQTRHVTNEKYLTEQRAVLDENQSTLEALRQKAELFTQRVSIPAHGVPEFDDIAWMAREMTVGEDEVEIAFLREKTRRITS